MSLWDLVQLLSQHGLVNTSFVLKDGSTVQGVHRASHVDGLGHGTLTLVDPRNGLNIVVNTTDIVKFNVTVSSR